MYKCIFMYIYAYFLICTKCIVWIINQELCTNKSGEFLFFPKKSVSRFRNIFWGVALRLNQQKRFHRSEIFVKNCLGVGSNRVSAADRLLERRRQTGADPGLSAAPKRHDRHGEPHRHRHHHHGKRAACQHSSCMLQHSLRFAMPVGDAII